MESMSVIEESTRIIAAEVASTHHTIAWSNFAAALEVSDSFVASHIAAMSTEMTGFVTSKEVTTLAAAFWRIAMALDHSRLRYSRSSLLLVRDELSHSSSSALSNCANPF